tara:strand:+ start:1305 stop:1883 length:579 start_codon:yes stop_codon:yes gene_type:complete
MAQSSDVTIGGTFGHYNSLYSTRWTITHQFGATVYKSPAALGFTDLSSIGTQYANIEFSEAFGSKALNGAIFEIVNSADAAVTCAWEWYNPAGTSFDGNVGGVSTQLGGTWTAIGTPAQDFGAVLDASVDAEWEAIQLATKWRVSVVSVSGATDVKAALNGANALTVTINGDKTAELRSSYSNDSSIGADPS